jgi:hypothetical protein
MRYVPSQPKPRWRDRAATWLRGALAVARRHPALAGIGLLFALAPVIKAVQPYLLGDEPLERSFMNDTFALVGNGLGQAVVIAIPAAVVMFFLSSLIVPVVLSRLRGRHWSRESEQRLLKWIFISIPLGVPVLLISAIVVLAILRVVASPVTQNINFFHVNVAKVEVSPLIRNLGSYSLDRPNAHLTGGYLAIGDNVVWLGSFPATRIFSSPLAPISDIHLRNNKLLIVTGDDLIRVDDDPQVGALLAHLPLAQMRIGLITQPEGFDVPLLLTGNDDTNGYVFELYGDAKYTVLLRADEQVVGAAGCMDDTAVAFADRVILLRKAAKPRLLLQLPSGGAPVTSVFARMIGGTDPSSCVWLIATKNAVLADRGGIATVLIAGLGGILSEDGDPGPSANDANTRFLLTDNERNTAVQVSLSATAKP